MINPVDSLAPLLGLDRGRWQ